MGEKGEGMGEKGESSKRYKSPAVKNSSWRYNVHHRENNQYYYNFVDMLLDLLWWSHYKEYEWWITILYTWNWHKIVCQKYFN